MSNITPAENEEERLPAGHVCPVHDRLNERLAGIEASIKELRDAIVGNAPMGQPGLIGRMATVETKVEQHDRKLLTWGSVVCAAGVAISFFKDWLK